LIKNTENMDYGNGKVHYGLLIPYSYSISGFGLKVFVFENFKEVL